MRKLLAASSSPTIENFPPQLVRKFLALDQLGDLCKSGLGIANLKSEKSKLRGLSLRANYTDRSTGEVSTDFCGLKVPRGQRDGPLRPILGFLDRASLKSAPNMTIKREK
jgi:hypothetical protein